MVVESIGHSIYKALGLIPKRTCSLQAHPALCDPWNLPVPLVLCYSFFEALSLVWER